MASLYIHIPFCERKCFYCSFVVSVGQEKRIGVYLDCLKQEASEYKGVKIQSVYIGGGTPTFLSVEQLRILFEMIHQYFLLDESVEWTIEANPEGLDVLKLKTLKGLGVNRFSLGIQSLNDKYLTYLGRNHSRSSAIESFKKIRGEGFKSTSADLMFLFPNQTCDEIRKDVEGMIALNPDHLSLYTLTIEENSRFFVKNVRLDVEDFQAEQYVLVVKMLESYAYQQYEVSNFAKTGYESKHNMCYWSGGNYIGLGVGAHSHNDGRRYSNVGTLMEYIKRMQGGQSPVAYSEQLDEPQRMQEKILLGLRMNKGVDVRRIEKEFNDDLDQGRRDMIGGFVRDGFLCWDNGILKTTMQGRLVLDELCSKLI